MILNLKQKPYSLVYHKDPYLGPFCVFYTSTNQGEFVIYADDTNIFIAAQNKEQPYKTANEVLRSVYIKALASARGSEKRKKNRKKI